MPTAIRPPTARQAEVLAAIRDYWRTHAKSPSVRELMAAMGFASPNAVVIHLRPLAAKGLIEWDRDGTSRGIWPAGLRAAIRAAVG